MSDDYGGAKRTLGLVLIMLGGWGVWAICLHTAFRVRGGMEFRDEDFVHALVIAPITLLLGARLRPSWMSTLGWILGICGLLTFMMAVGSESAPLFRERGVPTTYAICGGVLLLVGALLGLLARVRFRHGGAGS